MFLVTMLHTNNGCRLVRRIFTNLSKAEEFCDYHYNLGWTIWSFEPVDTTLSDMFATC